MDPSVCANPTFKTQGPKPDPNTVDIPNNISRSLKEAALRLKKEMEYVEPPRPVIEIKGETGQCIVVKELEDPAGSKTYLVIYRNSDSTGDFLYKVEKSLFRHVQFTSLSDCRVFVLAKMVRVFFMRCEGCQFSIRSPLIGPLEFYKCKNSHLSIRIPEALFCSAASQRDCGAESQSCGAASQRDCVHPIPLVMVEDCPQFNIYQSNRELVYVIKLCESVTGNIIDPKTKERKATYRLGKIFWGEQERTLVLLSRSQGFASVPDTYALNNMAHHLMIRPLGLEDSDSDPEIKVEDLFGTTPPAAKSGFLWRK